MYSFYFSLVQRFGGRREVDFGYFVEGLLQRCYLEVSFYVEVIGVGLVLLYAYCVMRDG